MNMRFSPEPTDVDQIVAMRNLWQAVAAAVLVDAPSEIGQMKLPRREAVRLKMKYFRGRHWALICECAGISNKPEMIEAWLLSDKAQGSANYIRAAMGATESRRVAA